MPLTRLAHIACACALLIAAIVLATTTPARAQGVSTQVIYVKHDAVGANTGASWEDAFNSLQDALAVAVTGDNDIWVALGTYQPDDGPGITPGDRTASFALKDSVSLYGGFVGSESSIQERDAKTNRSTLSGNIGDPASESDNSLRVVTGVGISAATAIDGFVITGARNADVEPGGGGIFLSDGSSPVFGNLTITDNVVEFWGGDGAGIYVNGAPELRDVTVSNNRAGGNGGGMVVVFSEPQTTVRMVRVAFENNHAGWAGGGLLVGGEGTANLESGRFESNTCAFSGAGGMQAGPGVRVSLAYVDFINNSTGPTWLTGGGGLQMKEGSLQGVAFVGNAVYCDSEPGEEYSCVGGGLYTNGSPSLNNVSFRNNYADHAGGGMFSDGGDPTFDGLSFTGNGVPTPGKTLTNRMAGGGLYVDGGSIAGWKLAADDNHAATGGGIAVSAATAELDYVALVGNTASGYGGGLACLVGGYYMDPIYSRCNVSDGRIDDNVAGSGGGGVLMGEGDLRGFDIGGNSAELGAGVFVYDAGPTVLRDLNIHDNVASGGGGGIMIGPGIRDLIDITLSRNRASGDGGGIHVERGSVRIAGARFSGNEAANGGAMIVRQHAQLSLANASLTGNSAVHDGGAISCVDGQCNVINTSFFGNQAAQGGAIAATGTVNIYNAILWGDSATDASTNEAFIDAAATARIGNSTVAGLALPGGFVDLGDNNHLDPLFADPDGLDDVVGTEDDNLRLMSASPGIDTGFNAYLPSDDLDIDGDGDTTELLPLDLDGNVRVVARIGDDAIVDRGPYEAEPDLPIEFTSARALVDGSTVTLHWTVRDHAEVQGFAIASATGDGLVEIARLTASADKSEYVYTLVAVQPGTHRFRIVAVHRDGTTTNVVEVVAVVGIDGAAVLLSEPWPNPTSGHASVTLNVARTQEVTVALFDIVGRRRSVVFRGEIAVSQPATIYFDARALPAGVYTIRARGAYASRDRMLVVR